MKRKFTNGNCIGRRTSGGDSMKDHVQLLLLHTCTCADHPKRETLAFASRAQCTAPMFLRLRVCGNVLLLTLARHLCTLLNLFFERHMGDL
eukprot:5191408-Amphidinium_carterae.1